MSDVNPYLSWRIHVLRLLREAGHRMDEHGPLLTAEEQKVMEQQYQEKRSPEEFVAALTVQNEQEKVS